MKNKFKFSVLLAILICMIGANAFAFDIKAKNADGATIYYMYKNDETELEVTRNSESKYKGDIVIPESVTYMNRTLKVTSIGYRAFYECYGLASVTIPNSVKYINEGAFFGCSRLTSVTIPNSVTDIGSSAFSNCSGFTSVTIPNSVTDIGSSAFYGCSGLTSITVPNSVTSIGDFAFYGCTNLITVTIGESVNWIHHMSFGDCYALTDFYCLAENVPNTRREPFLDSYIEYATLHVPAASLEKYKNKTPWNKFMKIVALDGSEGGSEIPEKEKCATPIINYVNGVISFDCETEGVEYVSEVTASDAKKYYDGKIILTNTIKVSVYATKAGFGNSDVVTKEFQITSGSDSNANGDVNGDGVVNAADIVKIVNVIMRE